MKVSLIAIICTILFCFSSCNNANKENKFNGYDVKHLNDSVSPCENFFAYTASNWIKANPIPETESRWGSFEMLIEQNNEKLKDLLEKIEKGTFKIGSPEQIIQNLYSTAMDTLAIEKAHHQPIEKDMAKIDEVKNLDDLAALTAYFHQYELAPLFNFSVGTDEKISSMYAVYFWQDGLGLPDRDYYFRQGQRAQNIRDSYQAYIEKVFGLYFKKDSKLLKNYSKIVFDIESKLASKHNTRVENRSPEKTYNKMTLNEIKDILSNFNLALYLKIINAKSFDDAVVSQPHYLAHINKLLREVSLEDWKIYYQWHLLKGFASNLSSAYVDASFEFYGKTLRGQKKPSPRWKKSLGFISGTTGELLGQIYVKEHFREDSKKRLNEMVENLRTAFSDRIKQLEWMSPETKQKALKKIGTFTKKIGYPDVWKSYDGLEVAKGDHMKNVKAIRKFGFHKMLADIGQPSDKNRWYMSPQTVNAYYDPTKNEVVFPAGILQPPFFTPSADDAINYGSIGVVIGHEFVHGFDDQGSKYDEKGNLNDWWTNTDREKFENKTKVLVKQFNAMSPLNGYNVNGELTLGENIADLGGLVMSYNAYLKSLEGNEPEAIDGFNYKQRFFLGYARLWRSAIRDEALIQRLQTDPHSPADARVNGPLRNLSIFQQAWNCQAENHMVLPDSAIANIW